MQIPLLGFNMGEANMPYNTFWGEVYRGVLLWTLWSLNYSIVWSNKELSGKGGLNMQR